MRVHVYSRGLWLPFHIHSGIAELKRDYYRRIKILWQKMTKCELNSTLMRRIKPTFNSSRRTVASSTYQVTSST